MEEHRERFSKNKILVISIENAKIPDSGVAVLANVSDPSSSCVNEIDVSLDALNLNSVCFSCFISNDACRDTVDFTDYDYSLPIDFIGCFSNRTNVKSSKFMGYSKLQW